MEADRTPAFGAPCPPIPKKALAELAAALDTWNELFQRAAHLDGFEPLGSISGEEHRVAVARQIVHPVGDLRDPATIRVATSDDLDAPTASAELASPQVMERIQTGDIVLAVQWHSALRGSFETLCVVNDEGIRYDPLLSGVALVQRVAVLPDHADTDCELVKVGWIWQKPEDYSRGEVRACVTVDCDEEGNAVRCRHSRSAFMQLGDADVALYPETPELQPDGRGCCVTKCAWGIATGTISVEVKLELDELKVEFGGTLGSSAEGGRTLADCCGAGTEGASTPIRIALPDPAVEATTPAGQAGGTTTTTTTTTTTRPDGTTTTTTTTTTSSPGGGHGASQAGQQDCRVTPTRHWMRVSDGPEGGRAVVMLTATVNGTRLPGARRSIRLDDDGDGANTDTIDLGSTVLAAHCDRPVVWSVVAEVSLFDHNNMRVWNEAHSFDADGPLPRCGDPRSRPTTMQRRMTLLDGAIMEFLAELVTRCEIGGSTEEPAGAGADPTDAPVAATPRACHPDVVVTRDFPIALKYAEVPAGRTCPTPLIGDVRAALRRRVSDLCAQGSCPSGRCVPETVAVSILRQLGTFSRVRGPVQECWVTIEAEVRTRCVCR